MKASIGSAKRSSTLFVGGSTCCGQAGSGHRAEKIRLCLDCGDYLIYSGPTFAPSHALTATCIGLSLVRKNGQTGRPKRLNKDRCNRSRPGALLVRNGSGQEIEFRRRLRFVNRTFNLMTIPKNEPGRHIWLHQRAYMAEQLVVTLTHPNLTATRTLLNLHRDFKTDMTVHIDCKR